MNTLLLACQFLPLLGFLLILGLGTSEKRIATLSFWCTHAMGISILALLGTWAWHGFPAYEYLWLTLYEEAGYHFHFLFYLDAIGATYLFCTWIIFSVIVRYCRYYLHRETGYKRFFLTIFAFVFGLNLVILSGSLDMLFAGWEIVGIASFLLIAFYRTRQQPIRNALRAYSIYRFCDIGLLLGALLGDLLFHGNNHFSEWAGVLNHGALSGPNTVGVFTLSLFLLIAACGKSAQFPFCFWLPRAMEGPTPSSAIFYGALSVHLGVFLLLRTRAIWEFEWISRAIVVIVGLLTVIVASLSEKAQSSIKGQIAYSSITQVGFMFMELGFGLDALVLIHFLGNAFLRCYQLLVSPSIVAHLLRVEGAADTGFDIKKAFTTPTLPLALRDSLPDVLRNTLQVCALQEFNLDLIVRSLLWDPLIRAGKTINAIALWRKFIAVSAVLFIGGLVVETGLLQRDVLAVPAALGMFMASLSAFAEKRNVYRVWNAVGLSGFLTGTVAWFASDTAGNGVDLFLAGIVPAWLIGLATLFFMLRQENYAETPFRYRAMSVRKTPLAMTLFLCFLGLVSFPITPAFVGQDLVIFHTTHSYPWIVVLFAFSFVLNGIAAAGVFQRLTMGRPVEAGDMACREDTVALWLTPRYWVTEGVSDK
jgi:formate hydrogenlyase subunit 3/multisubunit Na+/H+ antiporter MnhD subunit